jgi:NADPH:quinone reductase-like Zn-dependent oxidoreductase
VTVRAAVIEAPGRPPAVVDREPPDATPEQVPVEVTAAPITPLDLLCASGTSYFGVPVTPYVPGIQGQVSAMCAATAESPGAATSTGSAPWRGELTAGERVVVLGAGGVVGQAAVQLARAGGARRVVAGARSAAGQDRAKQAGADAVVALDSDDVTELAARFEAACDGPVDLVLDPLFGLPAAAAARTLRPGGRLVNLGSSAGETCPIDSSTLRSRSLRLLGYTNNALTPEQRGAALRIVAEHAARGALTVAHEIVPLDDVAAAWQRQASGAAAGRIVLVP